MWKNNLKPIYLNVLQHREVERSDVNNQVESQQLKYENGKMSYHGKLSYQQTPTEFHLNYNAKSNVQSIEPLTN